MTRLTIADDARLEEILDGTYPIWNEGLSRPAYSAWNRGQMRTEWGRRNLRRLALLNGDRLLASAKRYDFRAHVGGEPAAVLGIGAVFTPVDRRGHGYARALLEQMIEDAVARGCRYALLFSEIGPSYYAALGFHAIARTLCTLDVGRIDRPPATFVRSGTAADLPALADLSLRYAAEGRGFALDRTADLIGFGFARRSLLAGLGTSGLRQTEFFVAEEGYQAAAYVFITRGPSGIVLEECGDRDPTGARIGAILQVLTARTPAEPVLQMKGWLPPSLRPPQATVIDGPAAAELMMIRPLGDATTRSWEAGPVVYWQTDVF